MVSITAAQQWAVDLAGWAIPDEIAAQAPASPWSLSPACFTARANPATASTTRRALEMIDRAGPTVTVLDVGCGGGRASLGLAPPATSVIGVDEDPAMVEQFATDAKAFGVSATTIQGSWPTVAPAVPPVDVVVCAQVLYNVSDVIPFVSALTDQARVGVVLELDEVHPQVKTRAAWKHFWNLDRPEGPGVEQLLAVLREMGIAADVDRTEIPDHKLGIGVEDVERMRRRLCLGADRDEDIAEFMRAQPRPPRRLATIWWAT